MAGLAVGAMARDWRQALASGAAYGFALGFSFIASDYNGADPTVTKVPFFAVIGLVSAAFGVGLGLAGQWARARLRTRADGARR